MSDSIKDVLDKRQKTHGSFSVHARIATRLKETCKESPNWESLPPVYKEGIDMICHKLARILVGDMFHNDHVVDIQGYAKLMEEFLANEKVEQI